MVRFKHRYLLVHLVFPASLPNNLDPASDDPSRQESEAKAPSVTETSLISLLRESLSANFGDVGAGEVGGSFSIKYLSASTHLVILRVSREHLRTLWAALTLLRRVGGAEVIARVLHVSGTIRKIQHAAISHDREHILIAAARSRSALDRTAKKPVPTRAAEVAVSEAQAEVASSLEASERNIMAIEP